MQRQIPAVKRTMKEQSGLSSLSLNTMRKSSLRTRFRPAKCVARFCWQLSSVLLLLLNTQPATCQTQESSTDKWLADFNQLLGAISRHYANLDWVVHDRDVNLARLKQRVEERLRSSKSDTERRQTIESFLRAFGDAHVEVKWESGESSQPAQPASPPQPFCDRLGYNWSDANGGIDWSVSSEYAEIRDSDSQDFPAGVLRLPSKPALGVIRIGWFSEFAHPAICRVAQREQRISDDAPCDDDCRERFQLRVADLQTAALERRVVSLETAGAKRLLIDITGNGGGTNWVEPAARVLTAVQLKSPRYGFVKDEHWVKQLRERLAAVQADLAGATVNESHNLTEAASVLARGIEAASKPCALTIYWTQKDGTPDCFNLVANLLYSSGVLAYASPGQLAGLQSAPVLFYPSRYQYTEGTNSLPLMVLVDGDTGSSAEYFAAMLQDNKAAQIIGQVTVGAGCGFTNGGIRTKLDNSGAIVRLPDCVRLRSDGSNEVSGVIPDVLLPWVAKDTRHQQAAKLLRWLHSSWVP